MSYAFKRIHAAGAVIGCAACNNRLLRMPCGESGIKHSDTKQQVFELSRSWAAGLDKEGGQALWKHIYRPDNRLGNGHQMYRMSQPDEGADEPVKGEKHDTQQSNSIYSIDRSKQFCRW